MAVITNPADAEIMRRFGLDEEQWETMQDHANQLLGELQERQYPVIAAYLCLRYAGHLAGAQGGMSMMHMLEVDSSMDKLLRDAALWHFEEIVRANRPNEDDSAEVGVYPH